MNRKIFLLFSALFLVVGCSSGKKVFESSVEPQIQLASFEKNLENYWRMRHTDSAKTPAGFDILKHVFGNGLDGVRQSIRQSGLHDVKKISSESFLFEDEKQNVFKNNIDIEYDEKSDGFLFALLKDIPEEKRYVPASEDEPSDIFMIRDNTLIAFNMPLNWSEAVKSLPENSALRKKLNTFADEISGMELEEFAEYLTGEWGGLLNVNDIADSKKDGKIEIDFMFIIPDHDKSLFNKAGEKLILRRRAFFKDNMLHVRMFRNYPKAAMMHINDYVMIVSSLEALAKFGSIAEEKSLCSKIEKLGIKDDREDDYFLYWSKDFSAVMSSLLLDKSHALEFFRDYTGSDAFNTMERKNGQLHIEQYSDMPLASMIFMPYTMNLMLHLDAKFFIDSSHIFMERRKSAENSQCMEKMRKYAEDLKRYAECNINYPDGINISGLVKLRWFADIDEKEFSLPLEDGKSIHYGRFYYWGENYRSRDKKIPLLTDRGGVHENKIHVIFCDGSVEEFTLENVRSARRIVSFLHTLYNYDNATFDMLVKQAERLDTEKL